MCFPRSKDFIDKSLIHLPERWINGLCNRFIVWDEQSQNGIKIQGRMSFQYEMGWKRGN
jgi:hypothetical protein